MRFRTKPLVILVVSASVLGASLYGGFELYKEQVTEREHDRTTETATILAAQIDATVRERRDFVGFAASRPEASSFVHADRFARGFVDDSRFYAVQVVAANGTVVAFDGDITPASRERSIGTDVSDRSTGSVVYESRGATRVIESTTDDTACGNQWGHLWPRKNGEIETEAVPVAESGQWRPTQCAGSPTGASIPSICRMRMLFVSSLPSTVPRMTSFESGVGPTRTSSPSWKSRTEPCT